MRITYTTHDGKKHECRLRSATQDYVECDTACCPVCDGKVVMAAPALREVAVFDARRQPDVEADLRSRGERGVLRPSPPDRSEPMQLRGRGPHCDDRSCSAVAVHVRCGAEVGYLLVEFDTIFGLEEDARVLNGRPRVY